MDMSEDEVEERVWERKRRKVEVLPPLISAYAPNHMERELALKSSILKENEICHAGLPWI